MNEENAAGPWPDEHVADDFRTAIGESEWGGRVAIYSSAVPASERVEPISSDDVAEVTDWFVSYHDGGRYVVGSGNTGTELDLVAVLRLKDDRWASVQAWNDYTGWGCGEGSNVSVGISREQVIRFGLDDEGRRKLGLEPGRPDATGALIVAKYGRYDGEHHKEWVIDQMVRHLTGCPSHTVDVPAKHGAPAYSYEALGESEAYREFRAANPHWTEGVAP